MLGGSPEDVASFLAKTEGLDKTTIGDYIGEREDTALKVRRQRRRAALVAPHPLDVRPTGSGLSQHGRGTPHVVMLLPVRVGVGAGCVVCCRAGPPSCQARS